MAKQSRTDDDRRLLLQMVEESYRLPNWNETNLRSALRRVGPKMAAWKPLHGKHSIADIVVHCAYWKYSLRRRLCGGKRGSFPLKGSNWFETGDAIQGPQWSEYLVLLEDQHEQMCEAIRSAPRKLTNSKPRQSNKGSKWSSVQQTFWEAIHDGYHTGQINLIKAMYRRANSS